MSQKKKVQLITSLTAMVHLNVQFTSTETADGMFLSLVRWSNNKVDVRVAVNEWSWGRCSAQTVVPAGAALTRTSLSIQVYLRGRSAGLRRGLRTPPSNQACYEGADSGLVGWV